MAPYSKWTIWISLALSLTTFPSAFGAADLACDPHVNNPFADIERFMNETAATVGFLDKVEDYAKDWWDQSWLTAHQARTDQALAGLSLNDVPKDMALTTADRQAILDGAKTAFRTEQKEYGTAAGKYSGYDQRQKLLKLAATPKLSQEWIQDKTARLKAYLKTSTVAYIADLEKKATNYEKSAPGKLNFPDAANTAGAKYIRALAARTDLDAVLSTDQALHQKWLDDPRLQANGFKTPEYRTLISRGPTLDFLLKEDSGVSEGYAIGQHEGRVIDIFDAQKKYYRLDQVKLPPGVGKDMDRFFHAMIGYHDIGKSIAVRAGDKSYQDEFNGELLSRYLNAEHFTPAENKLAVALVAHDALGDYLKGSVRLDDTVKQLKERAKMAGMNEKDFFRLQTLFYTSDAGSYPYLTKKVFGAATESVDEAFTRELRIQNPKYQALAKAFGGDPLGDTP